MFSLDRDLKRQLRLLIENGRLPCQPSKGVGADLEVHEREGVLHCTTSCTPNREKYTKMCLVYACKRHRILFRKPVIIDVRFFEEGLAA